jgi:hypothetical protein
MIHLNKKDSLKISSNDFSVFENNIIYINSQNQIVSLKKKIINGEFYSFKIISNLLCAFDNIVNKTYVYDLLNKNKILFEYEFAINFRPDVYLSNDLNTTFCIAKINTTKYWCKFDFKELDIIEKYPINHGTNGIWKIINSKLFISLLQNKVFCHNLSSGDNVWQKEFDTNITKIEVWNERVVLLEPFSKHIIIALSSDNGQLLWEHSGWLFHIFDNAVYMIFNPDFDTLVLKKIDSGNTQNYDLSEILKENQLLDHATRMQYAIVDNLIYFSFFYKKTVAIINLETLELEWLHQIQTNASWITEPKVESNRLYILDSDNTLHIFEK